MVIQGSRGRGQVLRVYAFFDGAYFRDGVAGIGASWQDLNLREVAYIATRWVGDTWQGLPMVVSRVFVYDAVPEGAKQDNEVERWLQRNGQEMDVRIRRGGLVGAGKKLRQKAVDVQLAVDALNFAANAVYDVALFVTGDGDFAPVAEAVRERGPLVAVCCFRSSLSSILEEAADRIGYLPDDPNAWQGWRFSD